MDHREELRPELEPGNEMMALTQSSLTSGFHKAVSPSPIEDGLSHRLDERGREKKREKKSTYMHGSELMTRERKDSWCIHGFFSLNTCMDYRYVHIVFFRKRFRQGLCVYACAFFLFFFLSFLFFSSFF